MLEMVIRSELLARIDVISRFQRSRLGPLWGTISLAITIFAITFVFSRLFIQDRVNMVPSICIGFVIWQVISTTVVEATDSFVASGSLMHSTAMRPIEVSIRLVIKQLYLFAINCVLIPFFCWGYLDYLSIFTIVNIFMFLAVLMSTALMVTYIISTLCARFRDVGPAISSVMTLGFYATPIVWPKDALSGKLQFVLLHVNPFAFFVELGRFSFGLYEEFTGEIWPFLIFYLFLVVGSVFCFKKFENRVVFWV